jgi:hypothetical protein
MRLVEPLRHSEQPARPQPASPHRTVVAAKVDPLSEPAPARYVVAWLVGISGSARGESFPVRMGRNILGRSQKSDILITDDQASAHHADLVYRPDEKRYILMDHNSTNGTFVNNEEISPRRDLQPRDIIRIGKQKLMFVPLCDENFSWNEGEPER